MAPQGYDALRQQIGASGGSGSSGDNAFIGGESRAGYEQGIAPGGKSIGNDLPMREIHGGMPFSDGFSPSPVNPPLPAPGSDEGCGLPPSGGRR